jgi:peptidoglycan/xylan/chitin deacetylase (PgdA/CDA1 family)
MVLSGSAPRLSAAVENAVTNANTSAAMHAVSPMPERLVALTVDDGPSPVYTPQVLAMLDEYGAHATFFVIGKYAVRYPDLVRREVAQGSEVGTHTWSHPKMRQLGAERTREEVFRGADTVAAITGEAPPFFRPPYGAVTPQVVQAAAERKIPIVLWDVAVDRPLHATPEVKARWVLDHVRPGSIILMHDADGDRSGSVAAMEIVLRELEAQGYRVVTVSELLRASE